MRSEFKRAYQHFGRGLWLAGTLLTVLFMVRAEHLPIKTYTVADGLQRDNISRIRRDARGFLWFCTAEGISRFDGMGVTNFTVADGLPSRFVEDFLETKNGTVYIATGKGLARLNPHGLRGSTDNPLFTVFLPDNPKAEYIRTMFEDRNNQVWVGTGGGLYKLTERGGRTALEVVPLGQPLSDTIYVNEIIEDQRGALWIGTASDGLLRLSSNGVVRRFTTEDKLPENNITALLEDRDGQLWVGFHPGGGLCALDGKSDEIIVKKCYSAKDGLPSTWVTDLLQTSDGQIWAATVSGLCKWQGEGGASACKTYTAKNDLCDEVTTLAEDKDENLWTGSPCGAKKIARYGFTTYDEADGLNQKAIASVFENSAGELFVSTLSQRGISRFDGDKFSLVKPPLPKYVTYLGWGWHQTDWQDSAGAWWIPTGRGLFRSPDDTSFEQLAHASLNKIEIGAKGVETFRLFEDSRGDIWNAVANNELWRWERATNTWHDQTAQIGLSPTRLITAFVEDRSGNIWIGTGSDDAKENSEGRLIRYRDGQFRVFTDVEGAPRGWTRDLFLDSRGHLWIASTSDGLLRLDDTNTDRLAFVKYTPAEGLTSIVTTCVTEDKFGRIYVGTWRGIDRLDPETGQVENFTTADGLPTSFVQTAYRDRTGALWFGTYKGVVRFQPEPVRQRVPPTILITGLRVEGEAQSVSLLGEVTISNLELNSEQRQISVDFLGVGATLGEKLKYEYRFGNSEWTPTGERTVNFANLAPGAYRFEVRAVTADRLPSPAPATLTLRIAAPIWQRPWFILLVVAGIGLTAYLLYRYRVTRLLEVANMRTRIATDLHDDIGANLTKIAILSEVAMQKAGAGAEGPDSTLSSIARISRESVESMSDIVWAINPRSDSLLDLVRRMREHAEEVFALGDINLSFNAPGVEQHLKLGVDVRRDVFLVFKEAVNNAARHANCTCVEIDFSANESGLSLVVADDGQGFDTTIEGDGQGLPSMQRRAQMLGGNLCVESGVGRGTVVTLELSFSRLRHT